jgi:hypothetical protein
MFMRRSILISLAFAALHSASASAAPTLRYSWDDCGAVVPRRDFTGPAVYTQTVSVIGLDAPIDNFTLVIGFGSQSIPAAWAFHDLLPFFPPSCQPDGRVSMLLGGTSCDTLPGMQASGHYSASVAPDRFFLTIDGGGAGSFTPNPSQRYTLVRIAFNHANSVAGAGTPGSCGGADQPLQFAIGDLYLNGVDQRGRADWENCLLTWNTAWYAPDCPLYVPVKNRTWGQIKSMYR